ncbi:PLP-dependent aminotransferase family protein [Vibrio sp. HN007]|uniref:MocR-like pyridoxine biosynthesis transcription factor PdxR n=1 Tax=Vibrio iocasae TaxID=3098914 RepID=UPI0035D4292B
MQPIDCGDLSLSHNKSSKQEALFHAVREKIVSGLWPKEGKLPSSRKLAEELSVSRNTVTLVYEQLVAEGYIHSRRGSGFFVSVDLPEQFLGINKIDAKPERDAIATRINAPFAPGVPDLQKFPFMKWQKMVQKHMLRPILLGNQNIQGDKALRAALADYLSSSRSVKCHPGRIIITSGAQQALSIAAMATLHLSDSILIEQPGYTQIRKVIDLLKLNERPLHVEPKEGIDIDGVIASDAKALYVTPSNQYPMGTTLDTEQRLKLIEWSKKNRSWIIEDDYDSEFQFAHRPYTSLQGLAGQLDRDARVIYVGSFSKVMFNGLRIGYMVVPDSLVARCLEVKDALSGDTPSHVQAALADFISEGHLLRHIRMMRRLYKQKYELMVSAVKRHFGDLVDIISQPAGLHITLKWHAGVDENVFVERAKEVEIIVRALNYYERKDAIQRDWSGVVLGFGNIAIEDIDSRMADLAQLFQD